MADKNRPTTLVSVFCLGLGLGVALGMEDGALRYRWPRRSAPPTTEGKSPVDIPSAGWRAAIVDSWREFGQDRIPAAAAAVTFYVLLALFPAVSAFVSVYGLVSNVSDVQRQIGALRGFLPGGAMIVLGDDLTRLTHTPQGALGLAFAVSLGVSIWSANAGMKALIDGLNVAYEARERRGFIKLNLVSLSFTLGAILVLAAAVGLAVAGGRLSGVAGLSGAWGVGLVRWPLGLVAAAVLFSVLYRFGPCRPQAGWRWITPGGLFASAAWLAGSALFSWYVASFGHYDKTYGSLGAMVGFLTWIWLSLMVLMLGAEFNRALEKQVTHPA